MLELTLFIFNKPSYFRTALLTTMEWAKICAATSAIVGMLELTLFICLGMLELTLFICLEC